MPGSLCRASLRALAIVGVAAFAPLALADDAPVPAWTEWVRSGGPMTLSNAGPPLRPILVSDPPPPPAPRTEPGIDVYPGAPRIAPPQEYEPVPWSPTGLGQDTRIGPAGQPEWTTDRRFARVRTYVIAPWQVEAETWWYGKYPKDGDATHLFQQEIEIGLPCRWQLDLYANVEDPADGDLYYKATQVEVRHALADWDCLWGNPTIYLEWKFQTRDQPDVGEAKFLLCGDICPRWVWGANFAYERETSGEEEEVLGASVGVSYTVCDQRLSIGAEFQVERVTVAGARDEPEYEVLLGPSVQIQFDHRTHVDIVPLFGLTDDSPDLKIYVVFGVDLSGGGGEGGWYNPVSARSR